MHQLFSEICLERIYITMEENIIFMVGRPCKGLLEKAFIDVHHHVN